MNKTSTFRFLTSQIVFFIFLPFWLQLTNYLHLIVIGFVWFIYSLLILFILCCITKRKITISFFTLHTIIFFYSTILCVLLFFRPNGQNYGNINLLPFETIGFYLSSEVPLLIAVYNLGANVGLFIPFGLYYRYVYKNGSFIKLLVLSFSSISVIEVLQYLTKQGSLDIDDLLLNVLGVGIGYTLFHVMQKVIKIEPVS